MTLSPGDRLGRYEIQSQLGAGGMGEVYRASDSRLGRQVAVKVLPAQLVRDPERRELFEHEARATAALNHPNVLTIHDFGVERGIPFLVCELLDGETLGRRLRVGRLPESKVIDYGLQIARGLAAAHESGVVHCDLKPSNLFLTVEEQVKILDFGLARILHDEGPARPDPGRQGGTLGYQAPEQADGLEVDPRSDLFSFGAVLYEMRWGEPAFVRKTPLKTLSAVLIEDPPRRGLSELDRLIAQCLEKDPERRVPSARDVEWRLAELAGGAVPRRDVDSASSPPSTAEGPESGDTASSGSLFQLGRPPDDFVGRDDVLRELTRAVMQDEVTLLGLHGMGGVGKTSLALKLATALAPRYPDALIYLDLQGVGEEPLRPAQAMAHVIRSFHPQAGTPEDLAAVTSQYRSALHGLRVLLLMDNAADREQAEPLIPPAGSLLLTTSRRHFVLPGQVTRTLETLPREDAVALLRRIAPRCGEEAHRIAELCGDLPIALRLAGSSLAERPDLDPRSCARRLQAGRRRLELAEAAFALSFDLLGAELQARWCDLAVFPARFTAEAAAEVWDLALEEAQDLLGELVLVSLVEWGTGRYRLHDLASTFARERWTGERHKLRRRHAQHYLDVYRRARALYSEGDDSSQGLKLADREWVNVEAGWRWSEEHAEDNDGVARICSEYARIFATYVRWRLPPSEMACRLERALALARRLGDVDAEAIHLGNLAVSYMDRGEIERSLASSALELELNQAAGDLHRVALTQDRMGLIYAMQGRYDRARELFEEALATARQCGALVPECLSIGNLAFCDAHLGEINRARDLALRGLALARESHDICQMSYALGRLGMVYLRWGQLEDARKYLERSLGIARELGDWYTQCGVLEDLGSICLALGDRDRAVELFEEEIGIATRFNDPQSLAEAQWRLGGLLESEGELARAAELMQARVGYRRAIGHVDAEADADWVHKLRDSLGGIQGA